MFSIHITDKAWLIYFPHSDLVKTQKMRYNDDQNTTFKSVQYIPPFNLLPLSSAYTAQQTWGQ